MVPHRLVEPDSWAGHIPFAFWIAANFRPRRYVELGVHTGNSFCAVAQAVKHYGPRTASASTTGSAMNRQASMARTSTPTSRRGTILATVTSHDCCG
jgi:hypothetical protein